MIYINEISKIHEKENEQFIKDIQSDKLNIVFESTIINEEFRLDDIKNNQMFLYIRTKKYSGAFHDCTVKLINGGKYNFNGNLGLEIMVSKNNPHYFVWFGDGKAARGRAARAQSKLTDPEKKFIKKVINENYEDILVYWNLDLDDPKDLAIGREIELRIYNKYRGI